MNSTAPPPVILVVEDDSGQREMIEAVLTNSGMVAITVSDGFSAMNWLDEHKPDMVVLDLMLPDMSGFVVCQQIRRRFPLTAPPVLMISAAGHQANTRVPRLRGRR